MCASTLPSACDNADLIKCSKYSTAPLIMNLQSAVLTQAMRMQSAGSMQGQMLSKGDIACFKFSAASKGLPELYTACASGLSAAAPPGIQQTLL